MAPTRRTQRTDSKRMQVVRDEPVDVKKKASVGVKKASKGTKVKSMKQKRHKKRESYGRYIHRVLKRVHPQLSISKKGMAVMNSFVQDMFEQLATESSRLTSMNGRKVLSSLEVQTAVRLILPGDLAKLANSEGAKALQSYSANKKQ